MDVNINSTLNPCDCSCSCPYCNPKSLKRNLDQISEDDPNEIARVEIEREAAALRETLAKQQESIQSLCAELEEERAAASTAASEAMSMILRLQRDKAEAQMDARQFKLLSEERMAHDQQQIGVLEDLLFKRDEAVRFLSDQLLAYRHRLLSCGIVLNPPLLCESEKSVIDESFGSSSLQEEFPSMADRWSCTMDAVNCADVSTQSVIDERFGSSSLQREFGSGEFRSMAEPSSYAMDAVNGGDVSRRDAGNGNVEEGEIKRLYRRLQAMEADREAMREAIMAMGTDKAQRILVKEIARQLHKEAMPEKRIVKKAWFLRSFSVMFVFKWMASLFFWRKKSPRIKYPIGLSNQKAGLLLLLDSSQRKRLRRCLTRLPR